LPIHSMDRLYSARVFWLKLVCSASHCEPAATTDHLDCVNKHSRRAWTRQVLLVRNRTGAKDCRPKYSPYCECSAGSRTWAYSMGIRRGC
jgi:hypothetical protein